MSDQLAVLPQYLMPKQAMTRLAGRLASAEWGSFTTWVIKRFVKRYNVNMAEAVHSEPAHYKSFNEFFTRTLKPGAREFTGLISSPADGVVSACGAIQERSLIQAKGKQYTLEKLLADASLAEKFSKGSCATIYLSPKDYH